MADVASRVYKITATLDAAALRNAILLLGGDKTGDDRWYEVHVPIADRLYDEHLRELEKEGLL